MVVVVADAKPVTIVACPACGGTRASQVGTAATAFDTVIDGTSFRQPPYTIRTCEACGLYYKSDILAAIELAAYYHRLDSTVFEFDGDYPTDQILRHHLNTLPDGSRVLDFGCSTGRILKDLATRLRCFGVEPNAEAAAVARSRGIVILTEDALREESGHFDAILLTDVYEHLTDPVPLVQRLARRLAPSGWIAIVTGNADAISGRERLAEFWYFRLPGHVIMAGQRHLHWLASRAGLRIWRLSKCSHYRTPFSEQLKQRLQAFAYHRFRSAPRGVVARLLRATPRLSSAERWTTAPALTCGDDHVVALFEHAPSATGVKDA